MLKREPGGIEFTHRLKAVLFGNQVRHGSKSV
jgi:hypothetical protein